MKAENRRKLSEWLVTLPSFVWLLVLFLVPTLLVFAIMFKPATSYGGIGDGWTLETLWTLGNPNYPAIVWRTIWLSVAATALCILLATPMGYYMARVSPSRRRLVLLLVILPFWTSFLIRVYAWKGLLEANGWIGAPIHASGLDQVLAALGLIPSPEQLLYSPFSLVLGMVYTYLPFMVLPLYATLSRMDLRLLEAALDLGATPWQAFWRITVPLSKPGIVAGSMLVFIPCVGEYVIPELLGGPETLMIGRVLWDEFFANNDWPMASAVAVVMILLLLVPLALFGRNQAQAREGA